MKVLVTGAKGFVGRNLCESLKALRDGKDRRGRYQPLLPLEVFEYDTDSAIDDLSRYCQEADFVFNLAGVNRPQKQSTFMEGNCGFASELLNCLMSNGNTCPVMLASSIQAALSGRFADSPYGQSKLAAEELFRAYGDKTGAKVLIYRFPNIYGKWCRPNYNSAVATFCNNIANSAPIVVNDPSVELELLYIDDLVHTMLEALLGNEARDENGFCLVGPTDCVSVGTIVELLYSFKDLRDSFHIPHMHESSFTKKLYSTYLSYLDPVDFSYPLKMNVDKRGSFTEMLRTSDCGQVSINISKPGVVKGQHWHHSKWEMFCVVSGSALIKMRRIGVNPDGLPFPVHEFIVNGEELRVVDMIPGYTHSIENLSKTENLVTIMWANETFNPDSPDTYFEEV